MAINDFFPLDGGDDEIDLHDEFFNVPTTDDFVGETLKEQQKKKSEALLARILKGKLTFKEFKTLSKKNQEWYAKRFGRPPTASERQAQRNKVARDRKKRRAVRASRRANR